MGRIKLRDEEVLPWYCFYCQEEFKNVIGLAEHECEFKNTSN